jgi:tRNA threonylcarbamoyladenosine biosynthesis protein TsaB
VAAMKAVENADEALFCPMIDARRMEVYAAFYNSELNLVREIAADIIDKTSYQHILNEQPVYFFGNGADKCKTALSHSNARFLENITPLAENMIALAEKAYTAQQFVDVAYYEPFYLKEFQTTTPKKQI